jgi:hypothetical protein
MALPSTNRIAWTYHSDDGNDYRVSASKYLTDQNKLGGADGSAVAKAKPANLKMRHITIHVAGVGSRTVPVYTTDAPILVENATLNVALALDTHAGLSSGNPIPEGHIRRSVTRQAA